MVALLLSKLWMSAWLCGCAPKSALRQASLASGGSLLCSLNLESMRLEGVQNSVSGLIQDISTKLTKTGPYYLNIFLLLTFCIARISDLRSQIRDRFFIWYMVARLIASKSELQGAMIFPSFRMMCMSQLGS